MVVVNIRFADCVLCINKIKLEKTEEIAVL